MNMGFAVECIVLLVYWWLMWMTLPRVAYSNQDWIKPCRSFITTGVNGDISSTLRRVASWFWGRDGRKYKELYRPNI